MLIWARLRRNSRRYSSATEMIRPSVSGSTTHRELTCQKNLRTRLDAIESRIAIDALIAKYAEAFDTMNERLLATLWHPDSRLLLGANGNADGLDAILAQSRANMMRMPHMHHWMANALVTLDGDNGHGLVAANCLFYDIEKGALQVSGQYRDIYQRRNGRWAFQQRTFDMHFATPLQKLGSSRGNGTLRPSCVTRAAAN